MSNPIGFYVYQLRLEGASEPFYIGKGRGTRHRQHFLKSQLSYHCLKSSIIKNAQKKNVAVHSEILVEDLSEEEAFNIEKTLIAKYGRRDLGKGCLANMTDGGDGVCGREAEMNPMFGKKHTEESKRMMSESRKGFVQTLEHRQKNSLAKQGTGNSFYGKSHTEESIEKIRQAKTGVSSSTDHHKQRVSAALRGVPKSEETRRLMSEAGRGKPKPKKTCPHCGLTGGGPTMTRYHFAKCKKANTVTFD